MEEIYLDSICDTPFWVTILLIFLEYVTFLTMYSPTEPIVNLDHLKSVIYAMLCRFGAELAAGRLSLAQSALHSLRIPHFPAATDQMEFTKQNQSSHLRLSLLHCHRPVCLLRPAP